jgi:hypothetical protein
MITSPILSLGSAPCRKKIAIGNPTLCFWSNLSGDSFLFKQYLFSFQVKSSQYQFIPEIGKFVGFFFPPFSWIMHLLLYCDCFLFVFLISFIDAFMITYSLIYMRLFIHSLTWDNLFLFICLFFYDQLMLITITES